MADADILIGPGKLWRAPLAESNPDETSIAYDADWGGNWTDMGDILEGSPIVLSLPEEFTYVYTEQSTAAKNTVRTRREAAIKCALAEHSAANMEIVLDGTKTDTAAGGSQKGYSSIQIGSGTDVSFYKWGIEAFRKDSNDDKQPVRWFLHKGHIMLTGDTNYAKQNPTSIPVEIRILADGSQSSGEEIGELQIVTAPSTS